MSTVKINIGDDHTPIILREITAKKKRPLRARSSIILYDNHSYIYKWGVKVTGGGQSFWLGGYWYDNGEKKAPKGCRAEVRRFNRAAAA